MRPVAHPAPAGSSLRVCQAHVAPQAHLVRQRCNPRCLRSALRAQQVLLVLWDLAVLLAFMDRLVQQARQALTAEPEILGQQGLLAPPARLAPQGRTARMARLALWGHAAPRALTALLALPVRPAHKVRLGLPERKDPLVQQAPPGHPASRGWSARRDSRREI